MERHKGCAEGRNITMVDGQVPATDLDLRCFFDWSALARAADQRPARTSWRGGTEGPPHGCD